MLGRRSNVFNCDSGAFMAVFAVLYRRGKPYIRPIACSNILGIQVAPAQPIIEKQLPALNPNSWRSQSCTTHMTQRETSFSLIDSPQPNKPPPPTSHDPHTETSLTSVTPQFNVPQKPQAHNHPGLHAPHTTSPTTRRVLRWFVPVGRFWSRMF